MKRHFWGMLTAAVMAASAVPAVQAAANDYTYRREYDDGSFVDGRQFDRIGNFEMEEDTKGGFSAQWSDVYACTCSCGVWAEGMDRWKLLKDLNVTYNAELEGTGIRYYGIRMTSDQPDPFDGIVIEGWDGGNPVGGLLQKQDAEPKPVKTVEIDGTQYDIYKTDFTEASAPADGKKSYQQYWSVRRDNAYTAGQKNICKGTVSLAEHLRAWESLGADFNAVFMPHASFIAEAFGGDEHASTGSCKAEKLKLESVKRSIHDTDGGLKDWFAPYFRVGAEVRGQNIAGNHEREIFYANQFNSLSCNSGLSGAAMIRSVKGNEVTVNLNHADPVMLYAEKNGIPVYGNALLSGTMTYMLPEEMFEGTAADADARIEDQIKKTFGLLGSRYPNLNLYAYDVCEDMFSEEGGLPRSDYEESMKHKWSDVYGDDNDSYIIHAFKCARQYAPETCKLYLRDSGAVNPDRAEEICKLVRKIQAEGNYIDGIAMTISCHDEFDAAAYEQVFKKYIALGLDIQLADVRVSAAQDYLAEFTGTLWKEIFTLAMNYSEHISAVTLGDPVDYGLWTDAVPRGLFGSTPSGNDPIEPYACYYEIAAMDKTKQTADRTGDANCDGAVDIADAVLILRYAVSDTEAEITDQGVKNADTDKNGKADEKDAALILQYIAKKVTL